MSCVRIIGRNNNIYKKFGDYCVSEETNECCILCNLCQHYCETEEVLWLHFRKEHNFPLSFTAKHNDNNNLTCICTKNSSNGCVQTKIKSTEFDVMQFMEELMVVLEELARISFTAKSHEFQNVADCLEDQKEIEVCQETDKCEKGKPNKAGVFKIITRLQDLFQNLELKTCISNLETEINSDVNGTNLAPSFKDIEKIVGTNHINLGLDSTHLNENGNTLTLQSNIETNNLDYKKSYEDCKVLIEKMELETLSCVDFERINLEPVKAVENPEVLNDNTEFILFGFTNQTEVFISEGFETKHEKTAAHLASIKQAETFELENFEPQVTHKKALYSSNQNEALQSEETGLIMQNNEDSNDETLKPKLKNSVQHNKTDKYCSAQQMQNEGEMCGFDLKKEQGLEANTNVQNDCNKNNVETLTEDPAETEQKKLLTLLQLIEISNLNVNTAINHIEEKYCNLLIKLNAHPLQPIVEILSVMPVVPLETTSEVLALDGKIQNIKYLRDTFYKESLLIVATDPEIYVKIVWKYIMADRVVCLFTWDGERNHLKVIKNPIKGMAIFETLQAVFLKKFPKESNDYFKEHTILYFKKIGERIKRNLTEEYLFKEMDSARAKRSAMRLD